MIFWRKYIDPYWKYFVLGPLCIVVEVIGEVLMPKYLAIIINNASRHTPVYSINIMLLMVITAILMMAGGVGGAYFGAKASVNFAADIRVDIYKKVQSFSFANIDKFSTGSLITRLTNDVTQMQNFINILLRMSLRAPGMMIGSLIMVIILRPSLSLVFAVSIPFMIIFVAFIIAQGLPRFSKMQKKIDNLNNTVQENITNSRVVKSFVREKYEVEKFAKVNDELKQSGLSAMTVMILLSPVINLVLNFTIVAVLWYGGGMVLAEKNSMPIGDLSAFISYCNQILMSLMMLTMVIVMSSRSIASSNRIKEVLNEDTDIHDIHAKYKDKKVETGTIEFKDVSFRYYKNSQEKVLDNINLNIDKGTTVGIIGPTGSGKTTLVSMITRLYDPDEGQVLVDGIDVKDYSLANLRNGIGMVLQQNILFSGTIEENLRWGNENATKKEIRQVASFAQADKFISEFNKGYKTNLEQGGVNVSGGQKQRLCIARALLKKPKILIFDDSTSAVDTATESQIRAIFKNELADTTKIIIAQRISSVQDANQIFVIDEGRIVCRGIHDELMDSCDEYREIYYSQIDRK
ncbi:MAG: ABC transporter ATP-binding protein [Methanolobus sp.]|nr:ABC transporter ATP-binding protein [Methanolobus sp.]